MVDENLAMNNPETGTENEIQTTDTTPPQTNVSEFTIPDEYKTKDWIKNFEGQTGDELKSGIFKALDEKFSNVPDIPQNPQDYELEALLLDDKGEKTLSIEDDALNFFGDKFKELGLSKAQAQDLFKSYVKYGIEEFHKFTDANELESNINKMFSGNKEQRNTVESLLKEFLPQEDQKIIQDIVPNRVIEMFYKVAKGLVDKYGYREGTNNSNNSSNMRRTQADIDAEYNRIAGEMEALQRRPHSTEETTRLQAELMNLFK